MLTYFDVGNAHSPPSMRIAFGEANGVSWRAPVSDHPSEAHLIIEVAESSLSIDRDVKARLYAECGVPEYWIVNVRDGLIEVHTEIVRGAYTRIVPVRRGETVAPLAFPAVAVAVDRLI